MPSPASPRTVAIIYGIGEGPMLNHRLAKALSRHGFTLTSDPTTAEIILTHSGGVTELPKDLTGKIVVLTGPAYGAAGHSILGLSLEKFRLDLLYLVRRGQTGRWLLKTLTNTAYLILQAGRAVRMYRVVRSHQDLLPRLDARQTVVVRYAEDPWSALITPAEAARHPEYVFLNLPGSHDELWINPESTVAALHATL